MRLAAGPATVELRPARGGRIGRIVLDGRDLIRHDDTLAWHLWGCYPLAPWSNRIPRGVFRFRGREHLMPVNFEDGSALHGLVAEAAWRVVEASEAGAVLEVEAERAPFRVQVVQDFRLLSDRLAFTLSVRNAGDEDVPAGVGIHPWFPHGRLEVPAEEVWPGLLPTGPPRPVTEDEDLRAGAPPPPGLDHAYTALIASRARLPDLGLDLEWSDAVENVVVYTGKPGWMTVEPVTNANDGFGMLDRGWSRHGVQVLAPGAVLSVTYAFVWG